MFHFMKNALLSTSLMFVCLTGAHAQGLGPTVDSMLPTEKQQREPGSIPPPMAPRSVPGQVPAIEPSASVPRETTSSGESDQISYMVPPPPLNLYSGQDAPLTTSETANLLRARQWVDGETDLAATGEGGSLVFRFGAAMPSIVCAPLFVCNIALQPGEVVNNVSIGDPVRWKVTPAVSGPSGAVVQHIILKPSDIGLSTNMVVTTDRRAYTFKLVSRQHDWMPSVAFSYPEDEAAAWAQLRASNDRKIAATVLPETGQSIGDLDFGYRVAGDSPIWRPLRVYNDGTKTYIQFPKAMQSADAPVLVALGPDKSEQLVNYRVNGDRYIVDKVLDRALLLSGVGKHQTRVKIARSEER